MALAGAPARERKKRALALLEELGVAERASFKPDRLSGGEQQRLALAVAMANRPRLLLADEPTGEVDSVAAAAIYAAMRRLSAQEGVTVFIVTHDPGVMAQVDRVVAIRDGRTSTEIRRQRDASGALSEQQEYVLLDRQGRLQLPLSYLEALAMSERVLLRLEPDHIGVWPAPEDEDEGA